MMRRIAVKGFTLIEVLVVMVIIAIVTSVAVLTVGENKIKVMTSMAEALSQSLTLAEEKAMLTSTTIGFEIAGNHWRFLRLNGDVQLLADQALLDYQIPADIQVNLRVMNQNNAEEKSRVIISANGDMTPFEITLSKRGDQPRFIVKGNADGSISTERVL